MFKRGKLVLSLCVMVLCIGALAFGVYASTTISVTANGTIAFEAYDCVVFVEGRVENAVSSSNVPLSPIFSNTQISTSSKTIWTMGNLYFNEIESGNIPNIVITLAVSNKSSFAIAAELTFENSTLSEYVNVDIQKFESLSKWDGTPVDGVAGNIVITLSPVLHSDSSSDGFVGQSLNFSVKFAKSA